MKKQLSKFLPALLLCVFGLLLNLTASAQAPTIANVSPRKGPIGTQVHIIGTNFSLDPTKNVVFFGAVMAKNIQVISNTELVATVAVGTDNGNITITNLETKLICSTDGFFDITYTGSAPLKFTATPFVIYNFSTSDDIIPKDFDNDGKIDFLIHTGTNLVLMRNTSTPGTLTFVQNQTPINTTSFANYTYTPKVADFNGDGLLDIATVTAVTKTITIYTNTSNSNTPGISFSAADLAIGISGRAIEIADIDNDGKKDLIVAELASKAFAVLLNTSSSGISFGSENDYLDADNIYTLGVADTENRGVFDIVMGVNAVGVNIYRNTSTPGKIQLTSSLTLIPEYTSIVKGLEFKDLYGDRLPEMIVLFTNNFVVKGNQGGGTFSASLNYPFTNTSNASLYVSMDVADANGDGRSDVILNNPSSGETEIYLNNFSATNGFLPPVLIPTALTQLKTFLSDVDSDGKPDIVYGSSAYPGRASILLNTQIIPTDVVTLATTNNSSTAITLNGSVKANTADVSVSFEVGAVPDLSVSFTFPSATNGSVIAGAGVKDVNYTFNNPGAPGIYYYRVVATNTNGEISRGAILSFEVKTDIKSITTITPNPNNGSTGSVVYKVDFSGVVNGVTAANFTLAQTGGVKYATISNVQQNPIVGNLWQVTVSLGPVYADGTVQLSLANADNLSVPLINTLPFAGEIVAVNNIVISTKAETIPADILTNTSIVFHGYIVTYTTDVTVGFEYSTDPNLTTFTWVAATTSQQVNVNDVRTASYNLTGNFSADLYYRVVALDPSGNQFRGQIVRVPVFSAKVVGMTTITPNPNNGITDNGTVIYKVEFSKAVTGVTAANFALAQTGGVTGATISNVIQNPVVGNLWQVTVKLGAITGDGTVQLSLVNGDNLSSPLTTALPFAGEIVKVTQDILVTTLPASNFVANGATLNGSAQAKVDGVIAGFLYSTKPDLSNAKDASPTLTSIPKGSGFVAFSADLKNQNPGKYYYAAIATDNATATIVGNILSVDIPTSIIAMPLLMASPMPSPGTALYHVEFATPITGLTAANFNVQTTGGVSGVTISSVTADVNDPLSWIVSLDVPAGADGSLTLNLINDTGLQYKLAGLPFAGATLTIDGTPLAPQGLSANASDALVKLDWKAVADNNLSGYKIYAGIAPKATKFIANVAANVLTYTDANVVNGTTYYYRITARDAAGNESTFSNQVSATPQAGLAQKVNQTITFAALADKIYGDVGFDLLPVKSDQGLDITYSSSSPSVLITNKNHVEILHAGKATIFADQDGDITYNAAGQVWQELNILARPISIQANAATKVVGSVDPVLTWTLQGQYYNGDVNVLSGTPARDMGEGVGTYVIHQGTMVALNTDYTLTFLENEFAITAAPVQTVSIPQGLMATAGDAQVKLDWNANTEVNFKEYRLYSANMGNAPGLLTVIPAGATTYLNSGLANGIKYDYAISAVDDTGKESALSAIVSATPQAAPVAMAQSITFAALPDRTYGDADFDAGATASSNLLVKYTSSDNSIATFVKGKIHILHAGTVTIYANQAGNGAYAAAVQVSQILTIDPLTVTVTADVQSKAYGAADPALTYTYTPSLIGTDVFTSSLSRIAGELPGSYAIQQGTLALNNDYVIKLNSANFVINPIPLTLTADAKAKVYGTTDPTFTYVMTSGSLLSGDLLSGILSRTVGENVGSYVINQGSLTAGPKYAITMTGASMVISPAPLTITASATTKEVGDADPVLGYTVTAGKLAGTDVFSGTLDRAVGEGVGIYAIGQGSLTAGANYALSFVPATLTITLKSAANFKLDANNILTPNSDGKNDKLVIKGLEQYPMAKLTVVDREGRVVYMSEHYQNDFDGTYKGSPLATDTYYYVIDFGNGLGKIKDFVTIVN